MSNSVSVFTYYWCVDEKETDVTFIRVYGVDEQNRNVCVRVTGFTPYIYIELPDDVAWTAVNLQKIGDKIDEIMGAKKPLLKSLRMKERLFYAHLTADKNRKLFPYLLCTFSSERDVYSLLRRLEKPLRVNNIGLHKYKIHETNAGSILQMTCCASLDKAGWMTFKAAPILDESHKLTRCDLEYEVEWKKLASMSSVSSTSTTPSVGNVKIMAFDIEVNSSNPSAMPKASKPNDKIFQISCVVGRHLSPEMTQPYLLSLGDPDAHVVGEGVIIRTFTSESDLLVGFADLINEENPNVIVGYNVFGFDIPYIIDRARGVNGSPCLYELSKHGFHKTAEAIERTVKWSSAAMRNQEFRFLDAEGRLYVDLYPIVQRDYKLSNYKLKTVSEHILKDTKDDLDPQGIFACYRIGTVFTETDSGERVYSNEARLAMGKVGKYCVQDSMLVIKLFDKMQTWVGITEMANVFNVTPFAVFTQGQQIKVFSQVYKYCMFKNIVVEKDAYQVSDNERYMGAHVFQPVPGVYDRVVPFDFNSLYPSIIIAYNIDFSTLVIDESIPDSDCNVMEFEDHVWCDHDPKLIRWKELTASINATKEELKTLQAEKKTKMKKKDSERRAELDALIAELHSKLAIYSEERRGIKKSSFTMCEKRKYRFLKEPKGVLPTILQNLLDARKSTRQQIKVNKAKIENILLNAPSDDDKKTILSLNIVNGILDKRQLSYKVGSNSVYGAMGVRKGYLPFMPGAMCVTYLGRVNIEKAATVIPEKYGGKLIYGDSVAEDTPVLLRLPSGEICYRTIDKIPLDPESEGWVVGPGGKEKAVPLHGIEVWSDAGFTAIKCVIRHRTDKEMFRVVTDSGVVDVTEDHGLLNSMGEEVSPKEISVGSHLLGMDLPRLLHSSEVVVSSQVIDDAFVQGLFYANGSCGIYENDAWWEINSVNKALLEKCRAILLSSSAADDLTLTIVEDSSISSQSSGDLPNMFLKLAMIGNDITQLVEKWRSLLYDHRNHKKVPDHILTSTSNVQRSFLDGCCAAGDVHVHGSSFDTESKIGSASLFYLAASLGFDVSLNATTDKLHVASTTCSKTDFDVVKRIRSLGTTDRPVYDLETANHHFSAGIGRLVVHNTDSNYVFFPHLNTAVEIWDHSLRVAKEVSSLFPKPLNLEFESVIYWRFFIITKKRYMYTECNRDGQVGTKVGKKGVLLARRDNSLFVRRLYEAVIMRIFDKEDMLEVYLLIVREITKLLSHCCSYSDFVVTKAVGDTGDYRDIASFTEISKNKGGKDLSTPKFKIGDYTVSKIGDCKNAAKKNSAVDEADFYLKSLPGQVQLAERLRRRGQRVEAGSRIEYVVTNNGGHSAALATKMESYDYFVKFSGVLNIDYLYYLKAIVNPLDQLLNIAYGGSVRTGAKPHRFFQKNFVLKQYKLRVAHDEMIREIKSFSEPKFIVSAGNSNRLL